MAELKDGFYAVPDNIHHVDVGYLSVIKKRIDGKWYSADGVGFWRLDKWCTDKDIVAGKYVRMVPEHG